MFWGQILTEGKNYILEQNMNSPLLHISNACLAPNSKGKVGLFTKVNGKE